MIFIIAYFVLGAVACAGVYIMNRRETYWNGWDSFGTLLFMFPFWPIFAVTVANWVLRPNRTKCAWCGQISESDDERKEHIRHCDLHPMRLEIERVDANNRNLIELLDRAWKEIEEIRK